MSPTQNGIGSDLQIVLFGAHDVAGVRRHFAGSPSRWTRRGPSHQASGSAPTRTVVPVRAVDSIGRP